MTHHHHVNARLDHVLSEPICLSTWFTRDAAVTALVQAVAERTRSHLGWTVVAEATTLAADERGLSTFTLRRFVRDADGTDTTEEARMTLSTWACTCSTGDKAAR